MLPFRFKHLCIESVGMHLPSYRLSSAEIEDKLAPLYEQLNVPFGTLEKLSGIRSRGVFTKEDTPSRIATAAAMEALDGVGFPREEIGAVFNCSVTRDYFEPATGVIVHENLGFSESVMALDITNACIGFSNGILMIGNLIESGVIKAGLITAGENLVHILEATTEKLLNGNDLTRQDLLQLMPTFTLGSGAVAMVLCHESIATKGHRVIGSVARSASEHKELCIGNGDFCFNQEMGLFPIMTTDSPKLMAAAAQLGGRSWQDLSKYLDWSEDDLDQIFCHQVGKQVNEKFYNTMGLPMEKEYTVYQEYGNLVSAALPSAVITAAQHGEIAADSKVLLTAFGSGLNAIFTGIKW